MANNEETLLGQGYEEIIRDDSLDNTNQQLNRHVYNRSGRIDHEITDFILKRADYTNTFIAIDIAGLPNNTTLYLVDENSNQLYSPVDTNGNWITTRCSIAVGENNIIPLPAQFTANLASHIPFPAGTYNWKLQYPENDYYSGEEIPLEVEIRDFKVWDILTPEIYPNEDIKVKLKTYGDTYYPNTNFNTNLLTTHATYDETTGIITYPNQDITDLSISKHIQVINQSNNCFIDYEVKNPFYISIEGNTLLYKNNGDYDFELKCYQSNSNVTNDPTIYINNTQITQFSGKYIIVSSQGRGYKIQCNKFPPGTYQIEMTGQYNNTDYYTAFNEFEITTEQCTLSLTLEGDIIKTTYLYDNTTPIPNARIGLIDAHTNALLETAVSDAQGQCIWTTTESGIYKSVAYDMRTNEIILESNIITPLVYDIDIDNNGDLIISKYDNIPDSSIRVIDSVIDYEGDLFISLTEYNSINDIENAIYNVDIDENGNIYYNTIGD